MLSTSFLHSVLALTIRSFRRGSIHIHIHDCSGRPLESVDKEGPTYGRSLESVDKVRLTGDLLNQFIST
mgnify:CR=1 FL=1